MCGVLIWYSFGLTINPSYHTESNAVCERRLILISCLASRLDFCICWSRLLISLSTSVFYLFISLIFYLFYLYFIYFESAEVLCEGVSACADRF